MATLFIPDAVSRSGVGYRRWLAGEDVGTDIRTLQSFGVNVVRREFLAPLQDNLSTSNTLGYWGESSATGRWSHAASAVPGWGGAHLRVGPGTWPREDGL